MEDCHRECFPARPARSQSNRAAPWSQRGFALHSSGVLFIAGCHPGHGLGSSSRMYKRCLRDHSGHWAPWSNWCGDRFERRSVCRRQSGRTRFRDPLDRFQLGHTGHRWNWLIGPYGLAIDASNDLFISDYTGEDVIELSASCVSEEEGTAGANLGCQVLVASVSSWSGHPEGIALDGSGDVFLAAYSGTVPSVLVAEVPVGSYGCSTTACLTGIGYGLNQPAGVAIDAAGDVIITDRGNGRALKVRQNSFSFGAIAVGSTSTPATAYFNFNSSVPSTRHPIRC